MKLVNSLLLSFDLSQYNVALRTSVKFSIHSACLPAGSCDWKQEWGRHVAQTSFPFQVIELLFSYNPWKRFCIPLQIFIIIYWMYIGLWCQPKFKIICQNMLFWEMLVFAHQIQCNPISKFHHLPKAFLKLISQYVLNSNQWRQQL